MVYILILVGVSLAQVPKCPGLESWKDPGKLMCIMVANHTPGPKFKTIYPKGRHQLPCGLIMVACAKHGPTQVSGMGAVIVWAHLNKLGKHGPTRPTSRHKTRRMGAVGLKTRSTNTTMHMQFNTYIVLGAHTLVMQSF